MYAKTVKKECFDDKYGSYETLDEAMFACAMDENCEKIYDQGCIGGPYSLCPWNSPEYKSSGSCLYTKPGKYGKATKLQTIYLKHILSQSKHT